MLRGHMLLRSEHRRRVRRPARRSDRPRCTWPPPGRKSARTGSSSRAVCAVSVMFARTAKGGPSRARQRLLRPPWWGHVRAPVRLVAEESSVLERGSRRRGHRRSARPLRQTCPRRLRSRWPGERLVLGVAPRSPQARTRSRRCRRARWRGTRRGCPEPLCSRQAKAGSPRGRKASKNHGRGE